MLRAEEGEEAGAYAAKKHWRKIGLAESSWTGFLLELPGAQRGERCPGEALLQEWLRGSPGGMTDDRCRSPCRRH
jgi:hypothetical protein